MPRLDTRLESQGAEFLVLGALLLERIPTYKTYTNMPGYDLVATNPERNLSCRVQVKSRWNSYSSAFPIKNFNSDFVVFARLNRGNKAGTAKVSDPEFYVFPVSLLKDLPRTSGWGKLALNAIPEWKSYKSRWDLIRSHLDLPGARLTQTTGSPKSLRRGLSPIDQLQLTARRNPRSPR